MIVVEIVHGTAYAVDLSKPRDISLAVSAGPSPNAFHLPRATFSPFRMGEFVGSIEEGGPVRCDVVSLAPHGNGTHTECIGHIAGKQYVLRDCMRTVFAMGHLVTVALAQTGRGLMVSREAVEQQLAGVQTPVVVIRTTPNTLDKRTRQWSGDNPPCVHPDAMRWLVQQGVEHLIIDLPSVDPEEDDGALLSHHIFWQWPDDPRIHCTITELVYVPDELSDGLYGVCFGVAPFDGDAAPSSITLFAANKIDEESLT